MVLVVDRGPEDWSEAAISSVTNFEDMGFAFSVLPRLSLSPDDSGGREALPGAESFADFRLCSSRSRRLKTLTESNESFDHPPQET